MNRYTAFIVLAVLLVFLASCDSKTELRLWETELEGASFEGVPTLTFHGSKDRDIMLKFRTLFMSMSPDCQGMYILDEKSDQGFREYSYGGPSEGVAGKYYLVQFITERVEAYSVEAPLQLRHPQCDWGLVETSVHIGSDFTLGWGKRNPRAGGLLTLVNLRYASQEYFEKYKKRYKSTITWDNFPEEIKMHLFNVKVSHGSKYLVHYFEGQDDKSNVPFMPNDIMDKSVSIKMDLNVEDTIDEGKGQRLPDILPLKKWNKGLDVQNLKEWNKNFDE